MTPWRRSTAAVLTIVLGLTGSFATTSTGSAQEADRPGLTEGVDYRLVTAGDAAPWDGVLLTREAMDRLLDERQWLLDRIAARDQAMSAAESLITLKEEQLESYRKDLRGSGLRSGSGSARRSYSRDSPSTASGPRRSRHRECPRG